MTALWNRNRSMKVKEKDPLTSLSSLESVDEKAPDGSSSTVSIQTLCDQNVSAPIPFRKLFRFASTTDLCLNALALVAAVISGAAQPFLGLFLGNLSHALVNFLAVSSKTGATATDLEAVKTEFLDAVTRNAMLLAFTGLAVFVCTAVYMNVWSYTGEVNTKRIREGFFRAVIHQDVSFFDNIGTGEITTRIQNDTHLVQQAISEKIPLIVQYLSAFVTGFVLAYIRSWRLALVLTYMLLWISATGALMIKFIAKSLGIALQSIAEAGSIAEESISTIRTTQAFGLQDTLAGLYDTKVSAAEAAENKAALWSAVGHASLYFIIYSSYGLSIWYGTTLILKGQSEIGTVISVMYFILIGSLSVAFLAPELRAVTLGQIAAAKLYAIMERRPLIDSNNQSGLKPSTVAGNLVIENVTFAYPSRPDIPVLRGLSLSFPAGKTTALVGESGCGKSSILNLFERFYDPRSGIIRLDGMDLKDLNVKWLRRQIGFVSQEPVLFATTIRGNIERGLLGSIHENISEDEKMSIIHKAAVTANAHEFIQKLPKGYDTIVGERGSLLSVGQKQRIAIARAIVSDPSILLLDEATSALDTKTESVVQDALDKAATGRTTITVAHRLSTIKNADCIVVLGNGGIVEQGPHSELMQFQGAYSRLVEAQQLRDTVTLAEQSIAKTSEKLESDSGVHSIVQDLIPEATAQSKDSDVISEYREKDHGSWYLIKSLITITPSIFRSYCTAAVFAILTGLVMPLYGVIYAEAITAFRNTNNSDSLRMLGNRNALFFFVLSIYAGVCCGLEHFFSGISGAKLIAKLRSKSFRTILAQEVKFFDLEKHSTGALLSRLSVNPQKIGGLAGGTIGQILQSTTTIIAGPLVGLAFHWKLALVAIATMPLLVSTGYVRLRVVVLKDKRNREAYQTSAQIACEATDAVRTVASLTGEDYICDSYSKCLEEPLIRSNRTGVISNFIFALSTSMQYYIFGLVFWYGSQLLARLEVSSVALLVCLFSITQGAVQAANVFGFTRDISSAKDASSDIINLLELTPKTDEPTHAAIDSEGEIVFRDVSFSYPSLPGVEVLRKVNVVAQRGKRIALVGPSGSGKSTIIHLLQRFYDASSGVITLDGRDVKDLTVSKFRSIIALVSQEPTLYTGSIKFNVLLGTTRPHATVTEEEVELACRNANILEFIRSLPEGFETQVGNKGVQLSGGQRQRIAIARALIRNPKILLLDEATSALDSTSEKEVQDALDRASRGRTTITIAHRLSTIQNSDCIYFLKNGSVSETGTHEELLARRGDYYEHVHRQVLTME